ncbi:MAG: hypothetical protein D6732_18580 [Methanobacteriota archaeon]|nr:MAG: hypothetical protein D6732_18580 [Euryarchaeota archaeon]
MGGDGWAFLKEEGAGRGKTTFSADAPLLSLFVGCVSNEWPNRGGNGIKVTKSNVTRMKFCNLPDLGEILIINGGVPFHIIIFFFKNGLRT